MSDARHAEGPCIILSADSKGTYGTPPRTVNSVAGKLHEFQSIEPIAAAIAGDSATCHAVVAEFHEQLKKMKAERESSGLRLEQDNVRMAIRKAREHEYVHFVREAMQGLLSMNFDDWKRDTDPEIRKKGWVVMRACRLYFPVYMVIGGFVHGNWELSMAKGACTTVGGDAHYAVGAGDLAAYRCLHKHRHDYETTAPIALTIVAKAMEAARRAVPKYIGKPANFLVIARNQPVKYMPVDSQVLRKWVKTGIKKLREIADSELRAQLKSELQIYVSPNP